MMYSDDDMKKAIECARQVALSRIWDLDGYISPEEFHQLVLEEAGKAGEPRPPRMLVGEYGLQRVVK